MARQLTALRNIIAAAWSWSVLGGSMVIFFIPILLWRVVGWPVDRVNYFGGRLFRQAGAMTVRLTPRWHFTIQGTMPPDPRAPYVVVANHQSFADMLLLCLLPWEMKWLSKVEIMRVPVLGWLMWIANDVGVKRGRATSAKLAMAACRQRLRHHCSVVMFPEGTRAPTDEMLPFKDGAFRLAIEAGVAILPIAIIGTRDAIARHDWRINRAIAVAEVLEPVPTEGKSVAELRSEVREKIEAARIRMRAASATSSH